MDQQQQSPARSILQFAIVGLVLILLLVGVVYAVSYFANSRQQTVTTTERTAQQETQKTTETQKDTDAKQAEEDKKAAEEKKQQEQTAAKETARKAEEEKKKQEQAAAATQAPTSQPSEVASSGPEDTFFSLVAISLLAYVGYNFWQSYAHRKN